MKDLDLNKSLQELENEKWDEPDLSSSLVEKVQHIRKKLLKQLTVEDLRLMAGQQFSLEYIVPLSLYVLARNPFEEGDFYPGDLLVNILSIKSDFWEKRPELQPILRQVIKKAKDNLQDVDDEIKRLIMDCMRSIQEENIG